MEERKKPGLQKDISSIFSGLEEIDNGRQKPTPPPGDRGGEGPSALPPAGLREPHPRRPSGPAGSAPPPLIAGGDFPKRRNSFIGLDVGPSSIKLVQVYPVAGGWEVGGYALQELGAEGEGGWPFEADSFVRMLKNLFSGAGAPRSGVVCSLRGGEVLTTLLQLARMPKSELESACRLEAGRWASFNVEKAFLQQTVAGGESQRPGGKINYLVTVAGRETVGRVLGVLRDAGLQVAALLPLPFAWKAYLYSILRCEEESASAVVDVGSDRTRVAIYRGSALRFSREFDSGGAQITEAIVQAGKTFGIEGSLSWEEAERIQRSTELFPEDGSKTVRGSLTVSQVGGMVRPVLEKIVQESKRSFEFYRQLYRQEEVGKIFLCGGGVLMPGFVKFFRERIRQPVDFLSLPDSLKLHRSLGSGEELKTLFPRLARATALSLSRKWEVNFIPPLEKVLQNILRRRVAIIIPILMLFLTSFIFYRSKAALVPVHQQLVEQKREELKRIQEELAPLRVLSDLRKQLEVQRQAGQAGSLSQPNWKGVLKEFSRITPPSVILTGIMTLKGEGPRRIICNGRVLDSAGSPQLGVTQFIVRVENSPFFREVEKISEDTERGTFSFSCTLVH